MATSKELRLENLRALIAEFKTAEAVAQRASTAPMYLSQILNGAKSSTGKARGIGDALARRLEEGCGKEPGWMDRPHGESATEDNHGLRPGSFMRVRVVEDDDPSLVRIPKVKLRLSAGISGFEVEPERFDGATTAVPTNWMERNGYARDNLIAIHVRGESMEPTLYEDDLVVVNIADKKPVDGGVFAINYEGEPVVKRLSRDAGRWWLASDNPDQRKFHRKVCEGDACIIIGRVVRRESERF